VPVRPSPDVRREVPEPTPPAKELAQAAPKSRFHAPLNGSKPRDELCFECSNGRVTFIDLPALTTEMLDKIRATREDILRELNQQWRVERTTAAVGPFRLRYVLEREGQTTDAGPPPQSDSFRYSVSGWVLEPITQERGETLPTALAPNSNLRQITDAIDGKLTMVTFWVYPDSFVMARQLRDFLYDRGLDVAVRLLPTGTPIAASPRGAASRPN
jgi:hypothetical protein